MLTLENIVKIYGKGENKTEALRGISLQVKDGEMLAVMGTSGSGKSTLLNVIGCMDAFDSGEYFFNDTAVHKLRGGAGHRFRKQHIGFVFQQFALMNQYTVYENVELPLCIKNYPARERKKRVMEALEQMGIANLAKKLPPKLSGGQQQRCAIARAVAAGNELLLADEPTGALDKKTSGDIMDILEALHRDGKTVIVVTHDSHVADRADRILQMEDGRIVEGC